MASLKRVQTQPLALIKNGAQVMKLRLLNKEQSGNTNQTLMGGSFISLGVVRSFGAIVMLGALASGCASQMSGQQVTHRWHADDSTSEARYRQDHIACMADKADSQNNSVYSKDSVEFQGYKTCMTKKGYSLVASNGTAQQ